MPHKIVALDIGGVCLQILRQVFFDRYRLIAEAVSLAAIEREFECGRITAAEWLGRIRQLMPELQRLPDNQCWQQFRSIVGPEVPGIAALTAHWVRQGYHIIFFSNTSCVHADEVWRKISFSANISDAVYSYDAGFMKPDPEIYYYFEERFGVPDLYLDDSPDNIATARKLGWQNSHVFTGTGPWLQDK